MEQVKSASDWAEEMAKLRSIKPRPIAKLYGLKGPTPEQAATHSEQMKAWNKAYRNASKQQKIALERDNARFYAEISLA